MSLFSPANTLAFGRMAWDPMTASAAATAREWSELTWGIGEAANVCAEQLLLVSWQAFNNYSCPFGLGYVVDQFQHYFTDLAGWQGLTHPPNNGYGGGFNLSVATASAGYQRAEAYGQTYVGAFAHAVLRPETTPREYLLTFHHVPMTTPLAGITNTSLWLDMTLAYIAGARAADEFCAVWESLVLTVDPVRHAMAADTLRQGAMDAANFSNTAIYWWQRQLGGRSAASLEDDPVHR